MNNSRLSLNAVIFDFDGTLARLNIDFIQMRRGILGLIDSYGFPFGGLKHLFVLEMIEAGRTMISGRFPEKESIYIRQANELIKRVEMEAAENGKLIEGTREMLQELKNRHIKTGVVTRNCEAAVNRVFPDILSYFSSVVTREGTPFVKPHPEHLRSTLNKLQVGPEYAAMVGDHPMDIAIGLDVGTLTIGVLTGTSSINDLILAKADLILQKACDLVDIIL